MRVTLSVNSLQCRQFCFQYSVEYRGHRKIREQSTTRVWGVVEKSQLDEPVFEILGKSCYHGQNRAQH